jgi:hypothetical protein
MPARALGDHFAAAVAQVWHVAVVLKGCVKMRMDMVWLVE